MSVLIGVSNARIDNLTIEYGNGTWGSGLDIHYLATGIEVIGCVFTLNQSTWGGGVLIDGVDDCRFVDCEFTSNTASHGGGLYVNNIFNTSTEVINCRFYNNHAFGFGGAAANSSSHPFFRNCTFVNNRADREGGVLSNSGGDAQCVNCILWGNTPDAVYDQESVTTVSYSCIAGGWDGQGNFDADPGLADPDTGDLHPAPGSPCIDAGDNDGVLLPEQNDDLDFNPRFTDDRGTPDTGHGQAPMVDIGCYEFQGTTFALTDPIPGVAGRLNRLRAIGAAPGATDLPPKT